MATSGRVYSTKKKNSRFYIAWQQTSQSIEGNYTDIAWQVGLRIEEWDIWYTNAVRLDYAYIDGEKVASSITKSNLYGEAAAKDFEFARGTKRIYHNAAGEKSISLSVNGWLYDYGTVGEGTGTHELTAIPRKATVTSAPNFNDEQNPTITYSNPAGEIVESLQACISLTGETDNIKYRNISKSGTSYTFNLTSEERSILRGATGNSNSRNLIFAIKTIIGGVEYISQIEKTLTIINANPVLTATVVDANTTTIALTGSADKLVKYFSNAKATATYALQKNAINPVYKVTNGGTTSSNNPATFNSIESNVFNFSVTDSRKNTTAIAITKELINYIKLSCNINATIAVTGEINLNIAGNCFIGNFGAAANSTTIEYRYKELNGNYGAWIPITATLSNNKYTANAKITGLDYRKAYIVQARATDKLMSINSNEKQLKAIPVFDWGENDFQFNVDALDKNGNKLGTELTSADHSAAAISGKTLLESGFVSITPIANTPTTAVVTFKKRYAKVPVVMVTASTGVIGTQVLGASTNGVSNDSVNIVLTRTNTTPTTIYYYVFGEVE